MNQNLTLEEVRKSINLISYCGHHCEFCFMAKDCGGCRSNQNYCSYAGAFEDNKCPNIECCREKQINGCYECDDLLSCKKGYYEKENEYIAKATALFIKKHGEECYTATLKKAINSGADYPKTFDESSNVESAFKILEDYLEVI